VVPQRVADGGQDETPVGLTGVSVEEDGQDETPVGLTGVSVEEDGIDAYQLVG